MVVAVEVRFLNCPIIAMLLSAKSTFDLEQRSMLFRSRTHTLMVLSIPLQTAVEMEGVLQPS